MIKKRNYIAFSGRFILQNPGAGAWSCSIYNLDANTNTSITTGTNFVEHTTPNFLELQAIVTTLESIKSANKVYYVHDSPYIDNVVHKWIFQWEANDFKTAQGKPIHHEELIKKLSFERKRLTIVAILVKGKTKTIYNTIAENHARLHLYTKLQRIHPKETLSKLTTL